MMAIKQRAQKGFTVIELMFAIAFLAFILIFVVMTTIQLIMAYDKGVTVKNINESGRNIIETLSKDISASRTLVQPAGANRMCLDNVTYAWNPPPGPGGANKYASGTTTIQLVRVPDSAASLCVKNGGSYPTIPTAGAQELLSTNVAVPGISTAVTTPSVGPRLISLIVSLSTTGPYNSPTDPPVSPNPGKTCVSGLAGEFCATAIFTTTIYARQ